MSGKAALNLPSVVKTEGRDLGRLWMQRKTQNQVGFL